MARERRVKDEDDDPKPRPEPEPTPPPDDDPDRHIRRGGPGDEPAEPAAEPTPEPASTSTRVKIGRREFDVTPDIAAAMEERERDYMRGISLDRRDREELDRYRRAAQPAQSPAPTGPDFNTLLFENPTKALEMHGQQIEARMEAKYRSEQASARMWTKFFEDHPDLSEERLLVQARFQADYEEIADLPTSKAMDVLADNVRRDILRISRKSRGAGSVTPLPTNRATVEGATGERTAPPPRANPDDEPTSLSAEIKRRAAARRRAPKSA